MSRKWRIDSWLHRIAPEGNPFPGDPRHLFLRDQATLYEDLSDPGALLVGTGDSEESLNSVNHGAGRVMSRTAARGKSRRGKVIAPGKISDEQFKKSMAGIKLITNDRRRIKEEAPGAYKDIEEVVRVVTECGWAKPVAKMLPVAVLKG